jgi:hypothetical protein
MTTTDLLIEPMGGEKFIVISPDGEETPEMVLNEAEKYFGRKTEMWSTFGSKKIFDGIEIVNPVLKRNC